MTLQNEEIQRIAGLAPDRKVCPFKCADAKGRRPCSCYPGYNLDAAKRLWARFEAYTNKKDPA